MRNGIRRKGADGITETVNHVVERIKDFVTEPAFAKFLPDLFNRIHFRRIGGNKEQADVIRNAERAGLMPGGAIAAKKDDVVRKLVGQVVEKEIHTNGITGRQD